MRVLILAAGYGTRLYPLTLNTPKALLPIGGKPILSYILDKIESLQKTIKIEEIVIVTNNRFYKKFLGWRRKHKSSDIKIFNDGSNSPQERRGAIGDIKFGIKENSDDWLVVGSDNLFDWELKEFIFFALRKIPYPVVGIYDVKDKQVAKQLGVVRVTRTKRVKELVEKPRNPVTTLIATCVYFFPKDSLKLIDEYLSTHKLPDMAGKYIEWLITKTKVYAFFFQGNWWDIGTKKSLREANKFFGG